MKVVRVTANLPTIRENWAKYHFDDGSIVRIVYSRELGESQPDGPCSPEQRAAIFAHAAQAEWNALRDACKVALDALGCDRVRQDRLEAQKIIRAALDATEEAA